MIETDSEAYRAYPNLHNWFNKLWLSEQLGYDCGPAGIAPTRSGHYIVRPIINLVGMSVGAAKMWIEGGDTKGVDPGYFWCQWFEGHQISVDYEWAGKWNPVSCWEATVDDQHLYKFQKWERCGQYPELGSFFDDIADNGVTRINVEFVDGKPIEVHLRQSPDPDYDVLIPIWQGEEKKVDVFKELGYVYISDYDDADGQILKSRIGFMVKNYKEIQ